MSQTLTTTETVELVADGSFEQEAEQIAKALLRAHRRAADAAGEEQEIVSVRVGIDERLTMWAGSVGRTGTVTLETTLA